MIRVPISALRTARTVPKSIARSLSGITVHGLLAADLAMDDSSTRAPWRAVLPSREEFGESMPLMWHLDLQACLPAASKKLLENQRTKLQSDWDAVSRAFPSLLKDDYIYSWLVVNTRTFYYVAPGTKTKLKPDDCMALNPFADYFNHSDYGCDVVFGKDGFRVVTNRVYEQGEEVYISYGNHSNDFLLTEYGFIMGSNEWDEVKLDDVILQELSESEKERLKHAGFLGNYALDKGTICYRTQTALRILCIPPRQWQRFVDGLDDGDKDKSKVDIVLERLLKVSAKQAEDKIDTLSELGVGAPGQKQILIARWKQILSLLHEALKRIQSQ